MTSTIATPATDAQILQLHAAGKSIRDIAEQLAITVHRVRKTVATVATVDELRGMTADASKPEASTATGAPTADRGYTGWLRLDSIDPDPENRKHVDDDEFATLVASVREVGVLEPILVRPAGDRFELIAGERRWRAAETAAYTEILAVVRSFDDRQAAIAQALENLQRRNLTPLEEAHSIARVIRIGMKPADLGRTIGESTHWVNARVKVLAMPDVVRNAVDERQISLADVAVLDKLEPKELKAVLEEYSRPGNWRYAAERALEARKRTAAKAAIVAELQAAGKRVLYSDKPQRIDLLVTYGIDDVVPEELFDVELTEEQEDELQALVAKAEGEWAAKHELEPCSAWTISVYGEPKALQICTDVDRHGIGGASDLMFPKPIERSHDGGGTGAKTKARRLSLIEFLTSHFPERLHPADMDAVLADYVAKAAAPREVAKILQLPKPATDYKAAIEQYSSSGVGNRRLAALAVWMSEAITEGYHWVGPMAEVGKWALDRGWVNPHPELADIVFEQQLQLPHDEAEVA